MLRIALLATHPIQYQAPLFRALVGRGDVEIKVFYCWNFGVKEVMDPGFGRTIRWDVPLLDGYDHEFLPNRARSPGTNHFWGIVNPEAPLQIAKFRPDVVVVHNYVHFTENEVIAAARLFRVPVLLRSESNLLPRRPLLTTIAKRLVLTPLMHGLGGALAIGTLSAKYFEHYGVPKERIFVAPYSVDNSFFQARPDEVRAEALAWRKELGIAEDDLVVLYAAKLIPVKGCADLIAAFSAHPRPKAHLVIVGDGVLRDELSALARDAAFGQKNIHFLGFVNQKRMPAAYALGDLFVLPSRFEPWGLAVNEAMNLRQPIVVSDQVGSAPDLVGQDNGWVFPAGNVPSLTRVLDEALADRDGLRARGEASRRRIDGWGIPQTAEGFVKAARAAAGRL